MAKSDPLYVLKHHWLRFQSCEVLEVEMINLYGNRINLVSNAILMEEDQGFLDNDVFEYRKKIFDLSDADIEAKRKSVSSNGFSFENFGITNISSSACLVSLLPSLSSLASPYLMQIL